MPLTTIKQIKYQISALIIALLLPIATTAAENTGKSSNRSVSYALSAEPTPSTKEAQRQQTEIKTLPALQKQGFRNESGPVEKSTLSALNNQTGDFTVYDVSTDLIDDLDFDGFYHGFSVSIDADTVYNNASVYAQLYLSYEGGPWNLYASSAAYTINGDSSLDSFVIETELTEGYPPGYYDIRIELYDALTDEWLVSYGPYESASLSALPLEDSYNDGSNITDTHAIEADIIITSGGSMSGWWLMIFGLPVIARRFSNPLTQIALT